MGFARKDAVFPCFASSRKLALVSLILVEMGVSVKGEAQSRGLGVSEPKVAISPPRKM